MTDEKAGLHCPGCQGAPSWVFGDGTQAICENDDCPVLMWNPELSAAENFAGANYIDDIFEDGHDDV